MPSATPFTPQTSFLGAGWSFPPEFIAPAEESLGQVLMTAEERDIEASLRILLGTAKGERFLKPNYGLDLQALLFDPQSVSFLTSLKDQIRIQVLIYEPRIELLEVEIGSSTEADDQIHGVVRIHLSYAIRSTNSRYNLVYPFYLHDGSEVRPSRPVLPAGSL
jgi:phage baseplate assembly protein W